MVLGLRQQQDRTLQVHIPAVVLGAAEKLSRGPGGGGRKVTWSSTGVGLPMTQPLCGPELWGKAGAKQVGKGAGGGRPLWPVGSQPLHLADGTQCVDQGVQLILDTLQGSLDGVGIVQHIDGQGVGVKLHRERALDSRGIAPRIEASVDPQSLIGDHGRGKARIWRQGLQPPRQPEVGAR